MNKLSSIASSAALLIAGVAASVCAQAHPYVGVGYPGGGVVEPAGYGRPHLYGRDRYRHHEFYRDRYERFHHERWNHR